MARGTHKVSKVVLEDVINSMPDNVVTNILDRLPIQYVVRTAILSRKWRFKWTMLTHLVFDHMLYEYLVGLGIENWYDVKNIISKLLFHLKGPITEFVLYIPDDKVFDVEDINNWIMFLSRKGVKELSLKNKHVTPLKLSTHIFSCVELESLTLHNCSLYSPPTFCGLPNLLCLDLHLVAFRNKSFGETFTQSPLLEILKIGHHDHIEKFQLDEIAKFKNLKSLFLPSRSIAFWGFPFLIRDIGSCLPNLQVLVLDFQKRAFLGNSVDKKRVSTSFPCLRSLTLLQLDFSNEYKLLLAFDMILYSPKLQTLKITAENKDAVPVVVNKSARLFFKLYDIRLGRAGRAQLRNVVLQSFQGSKNQLLVIEMILACSPSLEKIGIYPESSEVLGGDNGKLMVATKLLTFNRASPSAKVDIYWS